MANAVVDSPDRARRQAARSRRHCCLYPSLSGHEAPAWPPLPRLGITLKRALLVLTNGEVARWPTVFAAT